MSDTATESTQAQVKPRTPVTPYHAAGIATKKLGAKYSTQTMYSLARRGVIKSNHAEWEAAGGRQAGFPVVFDGNDLARWLKAAKSGVARGRARVNMDELMAQYDDLEDVELIESDDTESDEDDEDPDGDASDLEAEFDDIEDEDTDEDTDEDDNVPSARHAGEARD